MFDTALEYCPALIFVYCTYYSMKTSKYAYEHACMAYLEVKSELAMLLSKRHYQLKTDNYMYQNLQ